MPHPGAEIELRVPSIHKAAGLLGYTPRVGLEAGIARTIAWYAENLAGELEAYRNLLLRGNPFGASRPASARLPRQSDSSFSVSENARPVPKWW